MKYSFSATLFVLLITATKAYGMASSNADNIEAYCPYSIMMMVAQHCLSYPEITKSVSNDLMKRYPRINTYSQLVKHFECRDSDKHKKSIIPAYLLRSIWQNMKQTCRLRISVRHCTCIPLAFAGNYHIADLFDSSSCTFHKNSAGAKDPCADILCP